MPLVNRFVKILYKLFVAKAQSKACNKEYVVSYGCSVVSLTSAERFRAVRRSENSRAGGSSNMVDIFCPPRLE